MPATPEAQAREEIDRLLMAAGWHVCGVKDANIHAARGVAIREFELAASHGAADYLLYVDGKAAGVIEAKKVGATLTGVEVQTARYAKGLPATFPSWRRPLPSVYESAGQRAFDWSYTTCLASATQVGENGSFFALGAISGNSLKSKCPTITTSRI